MDKMLFDNVLISGQSASAWDVNVISGNNCTWIRCGHSSTFQHGAIFGGGLRSFVWIDYNTENTGRSGKKNRTTGSVASGSTDLTVASTTGYATGDPVVVAGAADTLGRDHVSTVASIAGSVITMDTAAGRTVSDAPVTNAQWDDFLIAETGAGAYAPSGLVWIGGTAGGEAALGRLRYGLNFSGSVGEVALISMSVGMPSYDPNRVVSVLGGAGPIRQPPVTLQDYFRGSLLAPASNPTEFPRTLISSPAGKPTVMGLRASNGDGTGVFGNFEIRLGNAGQTLLAAARGSDQSFVARRYVLSSQSALSGTTPSVAGGNRFLASYGTATTVTNFADGVGGQIIYVRATTSNATIQHGTNIFYQDWG